jgi:hypothetical protein
MDKCIKGTLHPRSWALKYNMSESTLNTPPHTNSIPEADQANPSQTYSVIPTWVSDIDWSVPPRAGGLVATSK